MLAVKGYYDGKSFIPLGDIKVEKNKAAIITILDEYINDIDDLQTKLNMVSGISGILNDEEKSVVEEFDRIISKRLDISREADLNE
jgi:hypothetical protein